MRRRVNNKTKQNETQRKQPRVAGATSPFVAHLRELRRRLVYVSISVIAWSVAAYAVERQIVSVLLRPAHGQSFIYTSPIDGINFLFRLCLYVGIALSIPVIVYQLLRFIEPLMQRRSVRFIRYSTLASGVLAFGGMLFGYFAGLPTALYFLLHQFVNVQVHPLLTIDAYLSFVLVYMLGSALMFQIPLVILFIHRIRPLTPKDLLRHERWAVLFAIVVGFIMNPTPNLLDQLFVIGPIILSYQLGVLLIALQRHGSRRSAHVYTLRTQDAKVQADRWDRVLLSRPLLVPVPVRNEPFLPPEASTPAGQYEERSI